MTGQPGGQLAPSPVCAATCVVKQHLLCGRQSSHVVVARFLAQLGYEISAAVVSSHAALAIAHRALVIIELLIGSFRMVSFRAAATGQLHLQSILACRLGTQHLSERPCTGLVRPISPAKLSVVILEGS